MQMAVVMRQHLSSCHTGQGKICDHIFCIVCSSEAADNTHSTACINGGPRRKPPSYRHHTYLLQEPGWLNGVTATPDLGRGGSPPRSHSTEDRNPSGGAATGLRRQGFVGRATSWGQRLQRWCGESALGRTEGQVRHDPKRGHTAQRVGDSGGLGFQKLRKPSLTAMLPYARPVSALPDKLISPAPATGSSREQKESTHLAARSFSFPSAPATQDTRPAEAAAARAKMPEETPVKGDTLT